MRRRALTLLPFGLLTSGMAPGQRAWDMNIPLCTSTIQTFTTDQDADFLEKLGLLEGHLLIGRRLLEGGEARLAVPHFGHPIRELYTYVEARLNERRLPGFEAELSAMESFAEGGGRGSDGAFAQAWNALMPKLRAAQNFVPAERRASARFMLDHVGLIAFTVASDYAESIERGRIVNVVEYHDSMGFLMYATGIAGAQAQRAPSPQWAEVTAMLEEIRAQAYPELLPSPRPPISVRALRAKSDQIRAIARQLPA